MDVSDGGSTAIGAYLPWFYEAKELYVQVSEWQYMFLQELHILLSTGELTTPQAQLCEASFFLNGYDWIDNIEIQREKKTIAEIHLETLLAKVRKTNN